MEAILKIPSENFSNSHESHQPPGHVPREERLHFAVALLLETQSFPLRGVDLECRLQRLLAVNGSTRLAQVWRLGVGMGDGLGMGKVADLWFRQVITSDYYRILPI